MSIISTICNFSPLQTAASWLTGHKIYFAVITLLLGAIACYRLEVAYYQSKVIEAELASTREDLKRLKQERDALELKLTAYMKVKEQNENILKKSRKELEKMNESQLKDRLEGVMNRIKAVKRDEAN